jgi:hypothetical protein
VTVDSTRSIDVAVAVQLEACRRLNYSLIVSVINAATRSIVSLYVRFVCSQLCA